MQQAKKRRYSAPIGVELAMPKVPTRLIHHLPPSWAAWHTSSQVIESGCEGELWRCLLTVYIHGLQGARLLGLRPSQAVIALRAEVSTQSFLQITGTLVNQHMGVWDGRLPRNEEVKFSCSSASSVTKSNKSAAHVRHTRACDYV